MFFACCILHYILLSVDGYDTQHADEDITIYKKHLRRVENIVGSTDFTLQGINAMRHRYDIHHECAEEVHDTHFTLRDKLVERFNRKLSKGEIQWLK
jgi:hypothetical protein